MKLYLHYTIWNKAAHIPWLVEGIVNCIPKGSILDFVFDNCTDSSLPNLKNLCMNDLKGYEVRIFESTKKFRWPNTNDALRRFMDSGCDLFLSPQDDQKLQGRTIINDLVKVPESGIIGMRDGISEGTYWSSNFSRGSARTIWLRNGEFQKVTYVNDGPIALWRSTVEKIGLFDEQFWVHYTDNDYSHRCEKEGLENYVMGAEVIHEKWGCRKCGDIQSSEVWGDEFSKHDYNIYRKKWLLK